MTGKNLLNSRWGRILTFGILYISEGIPLGFAAVAMTAYMRRQGLEVSLIGAFIASFYLPWAFKWAWAPLVDMITLERWGGRKTWIGICQALMIVTLVAIAQIDYSRHFDLLITLVLVHNVFSATQDVAIDSLAVNTLQEDERATANGFMFGGAYVGQGLGGGVAMFISDQFGFDMAFIYVSLLLATIFSFLMLFVKDSAVRERVTETTVKIWSVLAAKTVDFLRELRRGFFQSGPGPIVGVLFALLPVGAMALSSSVASALQVDLGMDDSQIAELNVYGTVLSGIGCVVGGWAADRWGQRPMLALWYAMTTLPTLYIASQIDGPAGLAGLSINHYFAGSLVFAFCMGMHYGTGAAIFMGLTNPLVAATQFTGYMALKNLTISYTNFWQGHVADAFDYATVMYIDSVLVALPLLVIPFLKPARSPESTVSPDNTLLQEDG